MKRGTRVKVYEDPVTRRRLIGEAVVVREYPEMYQVKKGYYCDVRFLGERQVVVRWCIPDKRF